MEKYHRSHTFIYNNTHTHTLHEFSFKGMVSMPNIALCFTTYAFSLPPIYIPLICSMNFILLSKIILRR